LYNDKIFGYYKRYITDIIDLSSTVNTPNNLTVNMSTFDFYKYYKLGDDNIYIVLKIFEAVLGSNEGGIYFPKMEIDVPTFNNNIDDLNVNIYYSFSRDYYDYFNNYYDNDYVYTINYIILNANDIDNNTEGGGAGGSSYGVGANGGIGGFFNTSGKTPNNNCGAGGSGGGKGIHYGSNGGNGSNGLIIIEYL
jgi:hypothetical protein